MITVEEFMQDDPDTRSVLNMFNTQSLVASNQSSDPRELTVYTACSGIAAWDYHSTVSGFRVEQSSCAPNVFRVTWPEDLVSSPCVYILGEVK